MVKSNNLLYLKFLILNLFLLETTGFDFYSHSTIHYFFNEQITHSYALFSSKIILPRYGLLSSIYEIFSRVGIPLGYIILILIFLPLNLIINYIFNQNNNSKLNLSSLLFIIFLSYLILFYSALSLAILYIIAFVLSKKKFYLFGTFFHPVSIFLAPLILFFILKKYQYFIYMIFYMIFFYYCYLFTKYDIQTAFNGDNIKLYIEKEVFFEIIEYTYIYKSDQINSLLIFIFIFILFRKKGKSIFNFIVKILNIKFITLRSLNVFILFFIIVINIVLYYNSRSNLYNSLFKNNDVIYVSWFDFGTKDYIDSFDKLNNNR